MNDIQITEDELDSFTKDYLLDLAVPSVVGFQGSLGAGKTTIIKNIIRNLGIEEIVTSPTFNIVRSYNKEDLDIFNLLKRKKSYGLLSPKLTNKDGSTQLIGRAIPSLFNFILRFFFKYDNFSVKLHQKINSFTRRNCTN